MVDRGRNLESGVNPKNITKSLEFRFDFQLKPVRDSAFCGFAVDPRISLDARGVIGNFQREGFTVWGDFSVKLVRMFTLSEN